MTLLSWKLDRAKIPVGDFVVMNQKGEVVGEKEHHEYGFAYSSTARKNMEKFADTAIGSVHLEVRKNTPKGEAMELIEGLHRDRFCEHTYEDPDTGEIRVTQSKLDYEGRPIRKSPFEGKIENAISKAKRKTVLAGRSWHLLDTQRDMERFYVYRRDDNLVMGTEEAHNNGFFDVANAIEVGELLCQELHEAGACVGKLEQIGPMTWRWREIWAALAVKETTTTGAYADGGTW